MIHTVLETPAGMLLLSVFDESISVLARPVPRDVLLSPSALSACIREGGVYIIVFAAYPGDMHAIRVPPGIATADIGSRHVIRRAEAVEAVGETMLDLCCDLATEFACARFPAWRQEQDNRSDAVRAVLRATTPGEA